MQHTTNSHLSKTHIHISNKLLEGEIAQAQDEQPHDSKS